MTEKWEGFTQEEISNIVNQDYLINKDTIQSSSPVKKMTFKQNKFGKKNMTRERMLKSSKMHQLGSGEHQTGLPQGARLSITKIPEEDEVEETLSSSGGDKAVNISSSPPVPSRLSNDFETADDRRNNSCVGSLAVLSVPIEASLDEFEKRQNMIKEQNRQRKELLKKALEDRTKKTHEEARRLSQIEEELKKLDVQLSSDVSILRHQIEGASLEFMEAQKRFDRAEKEYLDAKLALFTKRERKELLTGHLCTIIEQNELRKAKKLSDLMDKLQLASVIIEKPLKMPGNTNNCECTEEKVGNITPTDAQGPT